MKKLLPLLLIAAAAFSTVKPEEATQELPQELEALVEQMVEASDSVDSEDVVFDDCNCCNQEDDNADDADTEEVEAPEAEDVKAEESE